MFGKKTIGTTVLAALVAMLVAGCANHEVVKSTGPRPPTEWNTVKIYQNYPAKYEDLGLITIPVTPEMRWDQEGDSNPGFEAMQKAAAAKGANGILLITPEGSYDVQANAGYNKEFYIVNLRNGTPRMIVFQAIYVLKEQPK